MSVQTSRFTGEEIVKKISSLYIIYSLTFACIIGLTVGCERETASYDELETDGKVESIARKKYSRFFKTIKKLGDFQRASQEVAPDSTLLKKSAAETDRVIEHMRPFPSTFQSRIALDALSYAARELLVLPGFSLPEVVGFWRNALLDPIFTKGREYYKTENTNVSTQLQLVKALQRGIGTKATDDMLLDIIPIVGPGPSEKVMEVCKNDSLVFKKIYNLLLYTRSFQKIGPPLWMITGAWFLAVEVDEWPLSFFAIKTWMIDDLLYLTFKDFNQGKVYAAVFDDPIPTESSQMDVWLMRAGGVMNSLAFNDSFAERVSASGLPTYDTHNYYNDYTLIATADSVKKEFRVIFKRDRIEESSFKFAGVDSIEVLFTESEIRSPSETITRLSATRYQGDSLLGGRFIPVRKGEGTAYLMRMGVHDNSLLTKIQESMMPEIRIINQ